jgi:type II secretory pathway component PulJ
MRLTYPVAVKNFANGSLPGRTGSSGGFVLLEVLIAMGLISGAWTASVDAYQRLALRNTKAESKRLELRSELDSFERDQQLRAVMNTRNDKVKGPNESSRVSHRNHTRHATSQSPAKDQR